MTISIQSKELEKLPRLRQANEDEASSLCSKIKEESSLNFSIG
jgi:hypothetical protein